MKLIAVHGTFLIKIGWGGSDAVGRAGRMLATIPRSGVTPNHHRLKTINSNLKRKANDKRSEPLLSSHKMQRNLRRANLASGPMALNF
jgi:hypothetical protein